MIELLYGAYKSRRKQKNLERIQGFLREISLLNFNDEACHIFGQYKSQLSLKGESIDNMDLMIASIALAYQATLVTNNTKHFARIKAAITGELEEWLDFVGHW
ncbi:MAG: PIN domain-containing protein [Prochloron sp. SP5CPC1]|nr:PIN domain-containing protein [Candidatus Paraprochloron terpiosi SP5CPC1]